MPGNVLVRRKKFAQFFTPKRIASFMADVLDLFGAFHRERVSALDPACGEGVFLDELLARQFVSPARLNGIDRDRQFLPYWKTSGLSAKLGKNLRVGDALSGARAKYDVVMGNPPFGNERVARKDSDSKCRIEERFAERFIELTAPGGFVAVILPAGLLANTATVTLRNQILSEAYPFGIVELAEDTFQHVGASARTCILFFKKLKENERLRTRQTLMCSMGYGSPYSSADDYLRDVLIDFRNWQSGVTSLVTSRLIPTADLWLSRWDAAWWNPRYAASFEKLKNSRHSLENLGNLDGDLEESGYIQFMTYGQVGRRELKESGVRFITTRNFDGMGLDPERCVKWIEADGWNDPARSRPRSGDVLLCGNGVACLGRSAFFDLDEPCNIEQNVVLLRPRGLPPEYLDAFLKSPTGQMQIERLTTGVGTAYLNFRNIRSLQVPIFPPEKVREVVRLWRLFHWAYRDRSPNTQDLLRSLLEYFETAI